MPQHTHDWLGAYGAGNDVRCAIGLGRHLMNAVRSENTGRLIETAHRYGEFTFQTRLINGALDPGLSQSVFVTALNAPQNFTNATDFHEWVSKQLESFDFEISIGFTNQWR